MAKKTDQGPSSSQDDKKSKTMKDKMSALKSFVNRINPRRSLTPKTSRSFNSPLLRTPRYTKDLIDGPHGSRSFIASLPIRPPSPPPDCDSQFRQLPFRFLGYGMAAGQALTYIPGAEPVGVLAACNLASLLFSCGHVGCLLWQECSYSKFLSTVMWESLATLIPTAVVYGVTQRVWFVCVNVSPDPLVRSLAPCICGLITCVAIQRPVDFLVDEIVDTVFDTERRL